MSTPSTATATHPHHPHYGYGHHSSYHGNTTQYSSNDPPLTSTSRFTSAYTSNAHLSSSSTRNSVSSVKQQAPSATMSTPQSTTDIAQNSKNERKPNWHEFYKNGPPKEIIVIDDDSPPPPPPPPQRRREDGILSYSNHLTMGNGLSGVHASKRRKTVVDPIPARQQDSYSYTDSPHFGDSGSGTISTDRTTSLHTTAPTSLGSHGSGGSAGTYVESGTVGQKRKRVTRQTTADEKRRKEIEVVGDAYSYYVPPPLPPIKAKEVYVQPVRDAIPRHEKVDDEDGHFMVVDNSELTDRYSVVKLLGQGTFGKVVEAFDKRRKTKCAIKIIRSVQKYRDASRIELRVLSTLSQNDEHNRNKCIHLRDCFDFRNHICIVTDLLGQSVFDFLKGNNFVPFPSSQIQSFARQLLTSVAFLHDLNLIHTDLKPENILLVHNAYQTFTYNKPIPTSSTMNQRTTKQRRVLLDTEIRLIDFGSATFDDEYHSSVVSTRHYRAPEIILNLGWSFACDIWSIGCILVEFYTGDALFQTHDNLEHLAMMEAVCGGKIDPKLVKAVMAGRGSNQASKFFKGSKLDYPQRDTSKASRKYVHAMKALNDIIPPSNTFNKQFLDLLKRIFIYDPNRRITAKEALKHPWFKESLVDDGTEAAKIRRAKEIGASYDR